MSSDSPPVRVAVAYWRDGGRYPRARSGGQGDQYLRAVTVMAATMERFDPSVRVELHTNIAAEDPAVAVLRRQGVDIVSTPFTSRMPDGYFHKFSASTYSIDVLTSLAASLHDDQVGLLVDPDLVWLSDPSPLFDHAEQAGLVAYPIGYPPDLLDLGLTRRRLTHLVVEMTGRPVSAPDALIAHLGGEVLGGTRSDLQRFAATCSDLWESSLDRFAAGTPPWLHTEEHVYSAAFHALGHADDHLTSAVRRVWTRPGRLRNVRPEDLGQIAWHALTEKGLGLDRLFASFLDETGAFEPGIPDDVFRARVARALAIHPSAADRLSFLASRCYARVRGRRLGPMPA